MDTEIKAFEKPLNIEQTRDLIASLRPDGTRPGHTTIMTLCAKGLPYHEDRSYPTPRRVFLESEVRTWFVSGTIQRDERARGVQLAKAM